jgi:hypothetical protein
MDWRLIGALTSATLSCGLLAVSVTALVLSGPGEPRKVPTSPTLLIESEAGRLTANLRPTDYSGGHDTDSKPQVGRLLGPDASPAPSTEPLGTASVKGGEQAIVRRPSPSNHAKPASPSVQARTEPMNGSKIKEPTDQYLQHSDHRKPASPSVSTPSSAQPKISIQEWRAIPTARANLFNLGGHLDQSGLVDSMASPHLRDAFKKIKNYNKLPPEAKAWIEEPNINLSKLAPYRALLGIDDRKIEQEQAVKFVRIASTRGIDVVELSTGAEDTADLLVLPPFH